MERTSVRLACISLVIAFGLTACSDHTGIVGQADRSELALKAEITSLQAPTPERTAVNLDSRGQALHGHDPVVYREHRTAFLASIEEYVSDNGGFCTCGVVLPKKVDGDPTVRSIVDGSLDPFLKEELKARFTAYLQGSLERVEQNWPTIRDVPARHLDT